jgi:hypothetical protein
MEPPQRPTAYEQLEGGDERTWGDYLRHPLGLAAVALLALMLGWGLISAHPWAPAKAPSVASRPSAGAASVSITSTGDRGTVATEPHVQPALVRVEVKVSLSATTAGGGEVLGMVGPGAATPWAKLPALLPGSSSVGLAGAVLDCQATTPDDPSAYGVAVVVKGRDGVETVQGALPPDLGRSWGDLLRLACASPAAG